MTRKVPFASMCLAVVGATGLTLGSAFAGAVPAAAIQGSIYVSPSGSDDNPGTSASQPVQTLQRAQQLVRTMNSNLSSDLTVVLEDGFYRLSGPLTLGPSDSGSNGHNVVWTADAGARPVLAGSVQITGWSQVPGSSNIWVAQGPAGIETRQLYVNGARAKRPRGLIPGTLTQTATGYTSSDPAMGTWLDPSGQPPSEVELIYHVDAGTGQWTEPRCPVQSISGTTITVAQPCFDNGTKRLQNHVDNNIHRPPTEVENSYQLLTSPGEWYLDTHSSKFYYIPLPGEDLTTADVEAPVLTPHLVEGQGTATNPIHNIVFNGIEFAYATDMTPSTGQGFSEVQANYQVTGPNGWAQQGLCQLVPNGACPYGAWTQVGADVSFTYDQSIQLTNDAFVHLGAAGLGLGDGSQNDLVKGNVVTDTSATGIEIGNVDMPLAAGADQTLDNTIEDNHVYGIAVEFIGGIGIDVGYAAGTMVAHNQIDHTPYSAMSVGWGGWLDKIAQPGQANFSHANTFANNLAFDHMQQRDDGGAIYTNGITGSSFATGEHIVNNVFHDQGGTPGSNGHVIYTDDGAAWVTITGNCVWNPGPVSPQGSNHPNYYPGVPGTVDPLTVSGNFFVSSAAGCPSSILSNAGLEASYSSLLSWTPAPNPPVGGCQTTMAPPTGVAGTAGPGQVTWTWTGPAADCVGVATYYAIYVYRADGSGQILESSTPALTATGLASGSYYTATVTAFDGARWTGWSGWAAWVLAG